MEPRPLAGAADQAAAGVARRGRARRGRGAPQDLAAAGLRRRGAQAARAAGAGLGGQGLPAAGRRLRRELRRVPPRHRARHLPRAAADGGGADLRREAAGGQGRAPRGPVRQAPLVRYRDRGRGDAAGLSRRHGQRHGLRQGVADAGAAAPAPRLRPVGVDAQPAARAGPGGLRRPPRGAPLEPRLRRPEHPGRALRGAGQPDRRHPRLHGRLRADRGDLAADPRDRVLHLPRGPDPGVRAGADPRRFDHRRLVRLLGAHALDRRPHAPGGRRPRRLPERRRQPAGHQGGPQPRARRPARPHRPAQPQTTRPAGSR